ncbi:MAG: MBL fold metallo-hydrolase [Pseudomonadota bacterium]|nr:MBL fold metallo-hydrolase [Pseudomonadota bacterium]
MKITCCGAAGTVTGSNYLVEAEGVRLLVDCGMFQGTRQLEERNRLDFPYRPETITHLLLTHAHIDHSGLIPKLVHDGFQGTILCTPATADLCEIMLADSAHIQEMEAGWQNRKKKRAGRSRFIEPLYTQEDVNAAMKLFRPLDYDQDIILFPKVRARYRDAGHILGSAIIELWIKENGKEIKLVFSGDLGNSNQPIIADPTTINEADVLFIESTYGDRFHRSMEDTNKEFQEIIIAAHRDGGNLIIPAFAVGRTQEMLYIINELYQKKQIPPMDVYLDSPLAIAATDIFLKHPECYDAETMEKLRNGDNPLKFPGFKFSRSTEESMRLNKINKGAIIIAASGMCNAGRIKHHLRYNLWKPEAHVVLVGYQAQGTTGRLIVDGAERVKIFGEYVAVKAHCHTIGGFSAHADQKGLLNWTEHFNQPPTNTVIVHGEPQAAEAFNNKLIQKGWHTNVPKIGDVIDVTPELGIAFSTEKAVEKLEFETEIQHSWNDLDEIVDRLDVMEDISDFQTRESLAPRLRKINQRLDEVKSYLAGGEVRS